MEKLIMAKTSWDESLTGEFSPEELVVLRDEDASQTVDRLWHSRGAPAYEAAITEVLMRNTRQAAQLARAFREHGGPGIVPDQYINLAFGPRLLRTLFETPIAQLPETGIPSLSLSTRS